MQNWEYLYVIIMSDTDLVLMINGELVKPFPNKDNPNVETLWDYLNRMGKEGWEAVTLSLLRSTMENSAKYLLLKRPTV
jgi:hypothetical protein